MSVGINGVDKQGIGVNGVQVKQALSDANSIVNKGVYDATLLETVDADLATANIKSGITIFGKVGPATVQDISAANALVGEVMLGRTFFSVTGTAKTGTLATVALADANSAYPAGYHAGAANLAAVDAHLAVGNIKTGVNIFGYVGTYDTTGSPIAAARMKTGDIGWANGAQITGTGTKTLSNLNEIVAEGYYAATTLSTVDADLAVGNIKSGITIFGFAGAATVQDISAADAAVTDVKAPRTFFSVTGAIKTGTMATVALAADNTAYPAGYHVGAASLAAIDADLAVGNIRSGINIFGYVGAATVQEIGAADAAATDVKAPRTFFSVTGAIKTGTLATVALAAASNTYPAGYHVGAASLTAVDGDLVTANIKSGITIFGVAGAATVQDISAANALVGEVATGRTFFSVTGAIKTGTLIVGEGLGVYGDGSDGVVVIAADAPLARDMYYSSLTIDAGKVLSTSGYRIFCTGIVLNNGTIRINGGNGGNAAADTVGAGGLAVGGGSLGFSGAGRVGWKANANIVEGGGGGGGGVMVICAKTITNNSVIEANGGTGGNAYYTVAALTQNPGIGADPLGNSLGGAGGAGGAGTSPAAIAGGAGGTVTVPTVYGTGYRSLPYAIGLRTLGEDAATNKINGGAGGGAGCTDSTAVYGCVTGSGGGGGGLIVLVYSSITLGTVTVNGGAGGAKVVIGAGAGNNGVVGSVGRIIQIPN